MNKYFIFFDDDKNIRDIWDPDDIIELQKEYIILTIRSFRALMEWIENHGVPSRISFDFHLAGIYFFKHKYQEHNLYSLSNFPDNLLLTGKNVAEWLLDYCEAKRIKFPEYDSHSFSSGSKKLILSTIENRIKNNKKLR